MTHTKYALQDTTYDWCVCVCVYAFSRSAENSVHCRVHNGSESLVGTDRLLIPFTDLSHQLSHRGAPSVQSVGSWRGEGCRLRGEGCRPRGQRERKGGETHEWTLQPVHSQPAAGAYRGKLAGRTVPTDRGPVGPGTGSLHASPGALCARLCISVSVHVCRGISVRVFECARSSGAGGPLRWCQRARGRGPFRAHLHVFWLGVRRMGISSMCCRSVVASASLLLLLPLAPASIRGAGQSRPGEKRSGEHTPWRATSTRTTRAIRSNLPALSPAASLSLALLFRYCSPRLLLLLLAFSCFFWPLLLFVAFVRASVLLVAAENDIVGDAIARARIRSRMRFWIEFQPTWEKRLTFDPY